MRHTSGVLLGVLGLGLIAVLTGLCVRQSLNSQFARYELLMAASQGDMERVRQALAGGADVNARDPAGMTAIGCAASAGHADVVIALTSAGADTNLPQELPSGIYGPPLVRETMIGNLRGAKLLIDAGADPNRRDSTQCTALWHAAAHGNTRLIELLLASGADVNVKCIGATTPLIKAAEYGNPEAVRALLRGEADQTVADNDGRTALDAARKAGDSEVTALLKVDGSKKQQPARVNR